jgi:hypothetical protein
MGIPHLCTSLHPSQRSRCQRRLDDTQNDETRIKTIPSIVENAAIFLSQASLCIDVAYSPWSRNFLVASFNEGWKADEGGAIESFAKDRF